MENTKYIGLREQILHADSVESADALMTKLASGYAVRYVNRCKSAYARTLKRLTTPKISGKQESEDGSIRTPTTTTAPRRDGSGYKNRKVRDGEGAGTDWSPGSHETVRDPRSQGAKMERRHKRRPFMQPKAEAGAGGFSAGLKGLDAALSTMAKAAQSSDHHVG